MPAFYLKIVPIKPQQKKTLGRLAHIMMQELKSKNECTEQKVPHRNKIANSSTSIPQLVIILRHISLVTRSLFRRLRH